MVIKSRKKSKAKNQKTRKNNKTAQFENTYEGLLKNDKILQFTPELQNLFNILKIDRGFVTEPYLNIKRDLVNTYLKTYNIQSVVFGLSGGIDSAIVLGILYYCSLLEDCPLKKIIAIMAPIDTIGTTGQKKATSKGVEVFNHFKKLDKRNLIESHITDLKEPTELMRNIINKHMNKNSMSDEDKAFTSGQLVSNMRVPAFYYYSALLINDNMRTIVTGTINRDEGSYIGYFGKASDAVADIQLISDIHKSEVYKIANFFKLPKSIINQAPSGDVYSGLNDLEMMGFSYDILEFYTLLKDFSDRGKYINELSIPSKNKLFEWVKRIEHRHRGNAFKYIGDDSNIHFDVFRRHTIGGAKLGLFNFRINRLFNIPQKVTLPSNKIKIDKLSNNIIMLDNVLSKKNCIYLKNVIHSIKNKVTTDEHGRKNTEKSFSFRCTTHNLELVNSCWNRINKFLEKNIIIGDMEWNPCGINPLLRVIKYLPGSGGLVPHYDFPFVQTVKYLKDENMDLAGNCKNETEVNIKSLYTMIIYITKNTSGATTFIRDPYRYIDLTEETRCGINLNDGPYGKDWDRMSKDKEILYNCLPDYGKVLLFKHETLHSGNILNKNDVDKIIIRTDIMYSGKKINKTKLPSKRQNMPYLNYTPWYKLNLNPEKEYTRDEVIRQYKKLGNTSLLKYVPLLSSRIWKAFLRSKFFVNKVSSTNNFTLNYLKNVGYFNDGKAILSLSKINENFLSTPVDKIQKYIEKMGDIDKKTQNKELVVLIMTCACAPTHEGHVNNFIEAKKILEKTGKYFVIGGYLVPDSDKYIKSKKIDIKKYGALNRLLSAADLCKNIEWLDIDPFISLYGTEDLNYTSYIDHIEEYLSRHIYTIKPIKICYLFGSDHCEFGYSFIGRGLGICLLRDKKHLKIFNDTKKELNDYNNRIFYEIPTNKSVLNKVISSTKIRKKDSSKEDDIEKEKILFYRKDHDWVKENVSLPKNLDLNKTQTKLYMNIIQKYYNIFAENLINYFKKSNIIVEPIIENEVFKSTKSKTRKNQKEKSKKKSRKNISNIYLSSCPGKKSNIYGNKELGYCLYISRSYAVSSLFNDIPKFINRLNYPLLKEQLLKFKKICNIDKNTKQLIDDDIATGKTVNFAKKELNTVSCKVRDILVSKNLTKEKDENTISDILDFRDLLIGVGEGLGVTLPNNERARAPYCLPYVNPAMRIITLKYDYQTILDFSRFIWEENYKLFMSLEANNIIFKLKDCNSTYVNIYKYIDFDDNSKLTDICKFHSDSFL